MKYSDGLFKFPIRVYDGFSVRKALKEEEEADIPKEADWVEGTARVPIMEVVGVVDYIPRGGSVESVEQDGWNCCSVFTRTLGDFICTLSSGEFEKLMDSFVDGYAEGIEELVNERMAEKEAAMPKKQGWWKRNFT